MCNLDYKKEQERIGCVNESESLVSQMDRPSQRERRRDAILDAAEKLFMEQGYERTGLAEIVKLSGGSLATLYELFGNKQGLLHALAARWRDEAMGDPFEPDADGLKSHADMLTDYARGRLETMRSPRAVALMRMLASESLRDRDFARQTYHDLHLPALRELSDVFAEWTAAGAAAIDDPEATAELFFSLISGDSVLSILMGTEEGLLDDAGVAWRLQLFFDHFQIRG